MVPHDLSLRQAERCARSVLSTNPEAAAARAYRRLAAALTEWTLLDVADRARSAASHQYA
jgi:hypothetical protein